METKLVPYTIKNYSSQDLTLHIVDILELPKLAAAAFPIKIESDSGATATSMRVLSITMPCLIND